MPTTERLIGRAEEQAVLRSFLADVDGSSRTCVLEGEAGIGKSALWRWCVTQAGERSWRMLTFAATRAEAGLAYAGVDALLVGVLGDVVPRLPAPQRRALAVALLQEEAEKGALDQRLIGVAFLGVLRLLAREGPVLVAVDDVQWLDDASAVVLAYAGRRLSAEPVGLLLAQRLAPSERLPRALSEGLPEQRLARLALPPLPREGVRWLLAERLDADLPQPALRRVWETSGGNPLFALELGRALLAAGVAPVPGRPLPVPETLGELVQARLAGLPVRSRDALLLAAGLAERRPALIAAAAQWSPPETMAALEAAAATGVVALDDEGVRFAHPLFAEALLAGETPEDLRRLHARLAGVVADVEQRARHRALAAAGPDGAVAALLDEAARRAAARGAPQSAAELAALAARLTLPDAPEQARGRRCRSADHAYRGGDFAHARETLEQVLAVTPPGGERADVLIALADMHWDDFPRSIELLGAALREAGDDSARACLARLRLSDIQTLAGEHLDTALATLRPVLGAAERTGDQELLMRVLCGTALLETFAGRPTPGLLERALELEESGCLVPAGEQPSKELARRLRFSGRYEEARSILAEALEPAVGDEPVRRIVLTNLVDLECRAGDFAAAERWLAQALELAQEIGVEEQGGIELYFSALVDSHLGRVEAARAAAERGIAVSAAVGDVVFEIHNRAVLGFLELSRGDAAAADAWLRPLVPRIVTMGYGEPCAFPVWPNAIEALVAIGEHLLARAYLEQFEQLARVCPSPWALATSTRCKGLLAAAEGDLAGALAALEGALADPARTGPFEHARTLLALGQAQRRAKRKRAAREALEQALAAFEQVGARLWAERTRAELARISGRAPATGALTPTERRVAELVARGRSNKQVAAELFVTVNTIEANLSRVYRKLGVRSRTELAHRLTSDERPDAPA